MSEGSKSPAVFALPEWDESPDSDHSETSGNDKDKSEARATDAPAKTTVTPRSTPQQSGMPAEHMLGIVISVVVVIAGLVLYTVGGLLAVGVLLVVVAVVGLIVLVTRSIHRNRHRRGPGRQGLDRAPRDRGRFGGGRGFPGRSHARGQGGAYSGHGGGRSGRSPFGGGRSSGGSGGRTAAQSGGTGGSRSANPFRRLADKVSGKSHRTGGAGRPGSSGKSSGGASASKSPTGGGGRHGGRGSGTSGSGGGGGRSLFGGGSRRNGGGDGSAGGTGRPKSKGDRGTRNSTSRDKWDDDTDRFGRRKRRKDRGKDLDDLDPTGRRRRRRRGRDRDEVDAVDDQGGTETGTEKDTASGNGGRFTDEAGAWYTGKSPYRRKDRKGKDRAGGKTDEAKPGTEKAGSAGEQNTETAENEPKKNSGTFFDEGAAWYTGDADEQSQHQDHTGGRDRNEEAQVIDLPVRGANDDMEELAARVRAAAKETPERERKPVMPTIDITKSSSSNVPAVSTYQGKVASLDSAPPAERVVTLRDLVEEVDKHARALYEEAEEYERQAQEMFGRDGLAWKGDDLMRLSAGCKEDAQSREGIRDAFAAQLEDIQARVN